MKSNKYRYYIHHGQQRCTVLPPLPQRNAYFNWTEDTH